jgi:hypothetical protein
MNTFPLGVRATVFGLSAACAATMLTSSFLVGYALFAGCAVAGMTWRRDEPPVLPFVLMYQWLQVTVGYFYFLLTGVFPDYYEPGNLELAVGYGLTGLLLLAAGARFVDWMSRSVAVQEEAQTRVVNLKALLVIVALLYSVDYLGLIAPNSGGSLAVMIDRALRLRQIPLLLLWIEVLRQGRHRSYLWISLAIVFIPQLGSYFSDFKTPLILMVIVFASFWRPWEATAKSFTLRSTLRVGAVVMLVLFLGLIWQGGAKRGIRRAYDGGDQVSNKALDRARLFVSEAREALPVVFNDTGEVLEDLVSRVSYVTFFSRVLDHVPAAEPHSEGELLKMALSNAFVPRFLAPDKAVLPSDSYYTRRFAGVIVTDSGTSISIGYMAEFYADWGVFGMFVSVFAYGAIIGLAMLAIRRFCPKYLVKPALMSVVLVVLTFEHQFIKGFAAILLATILSILITRVFGAMLARRIQLVADDDEGTGISMPPPRPALPTLRPMRRPV